MKLYIVTVTREAMVWAENKIDALSQVSEIEKWEESVSDAREANGARAKGWDDSCLVYHYARGDITWPRPRRFLQHNRCLTRRRLTCSIERKWNAQAT